MVQHPRARSTTLLALTIAGAFGTAYADEPAAPAAPPPDAVPAEVASPVPPAAATMLRGSLIDTSTGEPLPAATIQIKGGAGGDVTMVAELDGTYSVALTPGTYTIVFSTPEYVDQTRTLTITDQPSLEISIHLDPVPRTGSEETIEIHGTIDQRTESAVLAVRRAASTVSDAVSSQEIARTPDSNATASTSRSAASRVATSPRCSTASCCRAPSPIAMRSRSICFRPTCCRR
jgi:hypothetical protein